MFVDQLAGLPNDEELEREIDAASDEPESEPDTKPALPARFTRNQVAGSSEPVRAREPFRIDCRPSRSRTHSSRPETRKRWST